MEAQMVFKVPPEGRKVMARQAWTVIGALGIFCAVFVVSGYISFLYRHQEVAASVMGALSLIFRLFMILAGILCAVALPIFSLYMYFRFYRRGVWTKTTIDREGKKIVQLSPRKQESWNFHAVVSAEFHEDRSWLTGWASRDTGIGDIRLKVMRFNTEQIPQAVTSMIEIPGQHRSAFIALEQFLRGLPTLEGIIAFTQAQTGK
ncbi:MAG TPA: hypothetical protein VJC16_01645 [Candidatus Nanoarchaeia archaeon]|nr:hypothetical protein [Candidatus Nanoarchaeia archaeon]